VRDIGTLRKSVDQAHEPTCQTQTNGAYPHCTCRLFDNHHNALTCPYCNQKGLVLVDPADHLRERERLMAEKDQMELRALSVESAFHHAHRVMLENGSKLSAAEASLTTAQAENERLKDDVLRLSADAIGRFLALCKLRDEMRAEVCVCGRRATARRWADALDALLSPASAEKGTP
jgi:hypothetical protein